MIDLKLAKEIGATHFIDESLYKFTYGELYFYSDFDGFVKTAAIDTQLAKLQRIDFTEPEMVTKYVKVTDSIFDLRDDFEAGGLYFLWGGNYSKVNDEEELLYSYKVKRLYRKVEKPVDWKEVAREFVEESLNLGFFDNLDEIITCPTYSKERKEFTMLIKRLYPLIK